MQRGRRFLSTEVRGVRGRRSGPIGHRTEPPVRVRHQDPHIPVRVRTLDRPEPRVFSPKTHLNHLNIEKSRWARPDLNRSLCLPKAQVYQANPRARQTPRITRQIKRLASPPAETFGERVWPAVIFFSDVIGTTRTPSGRRYEHGAIPHMTQSADGGLVGNSLAHFSRLDAALSI